MKHLRPLVAAVALLWATNAAAETTLSVYYAWGGHKRFHEPIAELFMKENPEIKIEFRAAGENYDVAVQTVIRQSFANQKPDVFFAGYNTLRTLVERELAVPLDPLIAKEDMKSLGFEESALALGQLDGKQYSLPFTMSTLVVFYNADLVAKAGGDPNSFPVTWEETVDLAKRITALGPDTAGMYYGPGGDDWTAQALIMSYGGHMMTTDEREIAFDGPEGLSAFKLFRRFHDEGGQPAVGWKEAKELFVTGHLGMYFTSPSNVGSYGDLIGDKFDFRVAPTPVADPVKATLPTGGMGAVILTQEPEKVKAAWKYLKFVSGPVGQNVVVRETGYMPTNQLALGEGYLGDFYAAHPNWRVAATQVPRARPWYAWPGGNGAKIAQVFNDNLEAIAQGQKTPEEALGDTASEVRNLLPK